IVFVDRVVLGRFRQPAVVNLGLVALLVLSGEAAEEDTAIELLAVALAFDLQDEISPFAFGLQITRAVLEVNPAFLADGPFRFFVGMLFPAGVVFAVEERLHLERSKLEVSNEQFTPCRYDNRNRIGRICLDFGSLANKFTLTALGQH